jgi:hypothetical protein
MHCPAYSPSLEPSQIQVFSSAPCSQTLSIFSPYSCQGSVNFVGSIPSLRKIVLNIDFRWKKKAMNNKRTLTKHHSIKTVKIYLRKL